MAMAPSSLLACVCTASCTYISTHTQGAQRYNYRVSVGEACIFTLRQACPQVPGPTAALQPALTQCLISRMEGLWSSIARIILSMYCLSRKLISSCSFRASIS